MGEPLLYKQFSLDGSVVSGFKQLDKSEFRLSPLVSKNLNIEFCHNIEQDTVGAKPCLRPGQYRVATAYNISKMLSNQQPNGRCRGEAAEKVQSFNAL